MTAGSVLATVAVLGWAAVDTVGAFYIAWIAIGAAMALVLYEPAQVVLVKQFGAHATRAITTLTLVAGFASTIFQPLTAILADHLGWRTSLIVLAIALATVTIPSTSSCYRAGIPMRAPGRSSRPTGPGGDTTGPLRC